MINKSLFLGFTPLLLLSILLLLSSKNLFFMWASMELNMLSVLPLLSASSEGFQAEVTLKYFLVQAWGSLIFIWGAMATLKSEMAFCTQGATLALLLKVGVAPLHLWFISIMKVLDWKVFVLMSTLQKMIPLYLLFLFQVSAMLKIGIISSCISTLSVGSVKFLKKVMALSSVFSLAWLLTGGLENSSLWVVYLIIYMLGLIGLVSSLEMSVDSLSLGSLKESTWSVKLNIFLAFMVLAGLPPFVGFYGKFLLFSYGLSLSEGLICSALMGGAVWMMFVYVRSSYPLLSSGTHTESGSGESQTVTVGSISVLVGSSLIVLLNMSYMYWC